ncbi:C2 domain-containing protein At1g53590-like isoform X3 [Phragmites australis]|uniref:C2 domain-containing protein At1g53590-like isoform X3 n=1 Tax=Phragmites australis TaxID=29695 RepID=UPI002D779EC5|nr:C2 domain-containing protein At1g53590-like isoform X3 [Phragmites australis]
MDAAELPLVYHIGLVLAALWAAGSLGWRHSFLFLLAFLYLCMVNARCAMRLRKRIQHEEMKSAYQRRLLSDAESVRWLNHAIKKMWPICMEKIVSQLLRPIIPWFLDKFKPWTVSKASIQELYMGRNPPMFTSMRVLPETSDDDHLVLEIGMNFLSAEDMSVVLAMQLHKSVGLGMTANMHLTSMHVEGKDKLMDTAFGQTLVEPNMLVINVEKFASTPSENNWFSIEERPPIAYVKLEILEGTDMKPSDINGLADPYVKGRLGPFKFQTQIQKKTLSPKWFEEFKIPITSWEASNELVMEVRDKDPMFDDSLGACSIDVHELRGGQRHDKWISLKNVKKGRIHLAITVEDISELNLQGENVSGLEESLRKADAELPLSTSIDNKWDTGEVPEEKKVLIDEVEHISIDGEEPGGLYVHRPGTGVPRTWESRKGRVRSPDTQIYQEVDKSKEIPTPKSSGQGGLFNLGSFFRKNSRKGSSKDLDPSLPTTPGSQSVTELDPKLPQTPRPNLKELGEKRTSIKIVVNEEASPAGKVGDAENSTEDVAKVIEKNAGEPGRSLTSTLSRKVSRKRPEDRLADIPEQIEAHESELVSEGPIPVEGKPIDVLPTMEHGNGDGAAEEAVEAKTTTQAS